MVGGRLGDTFGRKRLFLAGMAAFTLTSLACGLAPTAHVPGGGRVAQGASAALMVPQVLATIQAATTGERRTRALGRYGATGGLAAVVGQVLGGLLVSANMDGLGWRPIFLVNVPIGLAGLILAQRLRAGHPARRAARVDRPAPPARPDGAGPADPADGGRSLHWPAWTIALLAISPLAAGRVRGGSSPASSGPAAPRWSRRRCCGTASMRRGLLLALPFFAGFGAFMFCYALLVQQGLRDSAWRPGPGSRRWRSTFLLASLSTSRLLRRFGARVPHRRRPSCRPSACSSWP